MPRLESFRIILLGDAGNRLLCEVSQGGCLLPENWRGELGKLSFGYPIWVAEFGGRRGKSFGSCLSFRELFLSFLTYLFSASTTIYATNAERPITVVLGSESTGVCVKGGYCKRARANNERGNRLLGPACRNVGWRDKAEMREGVWPVEEE
jgi:hypothetical protein